MGMSLNIGICPAQNHMITMIRDAIGDGFTVVSGYEYWHDYRYNI